jgi:hypothetical protein
MICVSEWCHRYIICNGKSELEFYKNLVIMLLKYVLAYASGGGPTLFDLFHVD